MSASGWIFWNFLAQTVAIFVNHSNGKWITSNIWKKLCELSLDSTFMLCTASTNSVKDMMGFLSRRHLLSSWWKSVQSLFSFEKKHAVCICCKSGHLGALFPFHLWVVSVGGRKLIEMQRPGGDQMRTSSLGNGRRSSKAAESGRKEVGIWGPGLAMSTKKLDTECRKEKKADWQGKGLGEAEFLIRVGEEIANAKQWEQDMSVKELLDPGGEKSGNDLRTDRQGDQAQSRGWGEVLQNQKTGMRKRKSGDCST